MMKVKKVASHLLLYLLFISTTYSQTPKYLDPNVPVEDRVVDLLSKMTLQEKLDYIGGTNSMFIRNISRLSVPEIKMSDGPVGVRTWGSTTAYPAGIINSATWDTSLVNQLGHSLGRDARSRGVHILLGPGLNIYRAPMCGRNFEYFGEDPYLTSQMAVTYINGVQSEGVMATAKHYAANNQEWNRYDISSEVDERTLREIYFPAFEAAVKDGKAGTVMTAYNLLNGIHCTQSNYLQNQVLKSDWDFKGFVMSDWGATHNGLEAARGGLDIEMPSGDNMNSANLTPYLNNGTLQESVIDEKVRRILYEIIKFGFFDRNQTNTSIPMDDPENAAIALNLAEEGMVLLKNTDTILPFNKLAITSVAVVGDLADSYITGGGSSYTSPFHSVSVAKGIKNLLGSGVTVNVSTNIASSDPGYSTSVFYTDTSLSTPGLLGHYFNNQTLSGSSQNRIDTHINFLWSGTPGVTGIGADHFSVRWTGCIKPAQTGNYLFTVAGDDGYRLKINDSLIIDYWNDHATVIQNKIFGLIADSVYNITLEYYENAGSAEIRMGYVPFDMSTTQAVQYAAASDVAVVCVGFGSDREGEGWDRDYSLPLVQQELIKAVTHVNPKTVVVLFSGGGVATTGWIDSAKAFLFAGYPGQEGGTAIAEILFGDVNPSGKLPYSFEKKWEDNPVHNYYYDANNDGKVTYGEGLFVGYRYYDTATTVSPLFPFGFGLSYTNFDYSDLVISPNDTADFTALNVSYKIKNTGTLNGAEAAQVYVREINPSVVRPYKELKGFTKFEIIPGQTKTAQIFLNLRAFSYYDLNLASWNFKPGKFEILVGASSKDIRLRDTFDLSGSMVKPQIIMLMPSNGAFGISTDANFEIKFNQNIVCHTGNLYLKRYDNDQLVETFPSGTLTINKNMVNFQSATPLETGTKYYIEADIGLFTNSYGKSPQVLTGHDSWNFQTMPVTANNISQNELPELSIFPNPATNEISIVNRPFMPDGEIKILDLYSRVLIDKPITSEQENIDISSLSNGLYFIEVNFGERKTIQKFTRISQ
jgi:beta-glucosidase